MSLQQSRFFNQLVISREQRPRDWVLINYWWSQEWRTCSWMWTHSLVPLASGLPTKG